MSDWRGESYAAYGATRVEALDMLCAVMRRDRRVERRPLAVRHEWSAPNAFDPLGVHRFEVDTVPAP